MLNNPFFYRPTIFIAFGMSLVLAACDHRTPPDPALISDTRVILLNDANQLLRISARTPNSIQRTTTIQGLQTGEQIISIDFRPATGQLYGLSNRSRIYVLDDSLGTARATGAPFTPTLNRFAQTTPRPESGEGFDFNPAVDLIRVVTGPRQNLRVSPITGQVVGVDPDIITGNGSGVQNIALQGLAYSQNRGGDTRTTLYGIDPVTDQLYELTSPNNGVITSSKGALGMNISAVGGFDITPPQEQAELGQGLAAITFEGRSELHSVNLQNGRLQKLGDLPGNIIGLAIPTRFIIYSIYDGNRLANYDPIGAGGIRNNLVTGLQAGERLVGLDFRPANGQLYSVSSASRLFSINAATGAGTLVGTLSIPLNGTEFGFDFNPTVDRIRIVSNTGQNLRVDPDNATTTVDGPLNGATSSITSSAYTNNVAGATSTQLFGINSTNRTLYLQNPPNDGTQLLVGPLNLSENVVGFDIGGRTGTAYALVTTSSSFPSLYRVDLNTGAATLVRFNNFGVSISSLYGSSDVSGFAVGLGF